MRGRSLIRAGLRSLGAIQGAEIWEVHTDVAAAQISGLASVLSQSESARAAAYGTEQLRARYVVRRGTLRLLLANCLDEEPESVAIREEPGKKPVLVSGRLHFNLSFSGDLALFAISAGHEVGIDVERIAPEFPMEATVQDHFTASEQALLSSAAAADRAALFFAFWTRKEACAKALGIGITDSLAFYETRLPAGAFDSPMAVCERLQVWDVEVVEGYAGALAVFESE
jgi:4'-phosphopantetheinyl transferase